MAETRKERFSAQLGAKNTLSASYRFRQGLSRRLINQFIKPLFPDAELSLGHREYDAALYVLKERAKKFGYNDESIDLLPKKINPQ